MHIWFSNTIDWFYWLLSNVTRVSNAAMLDQLHG